MVTEVGGEAVSHGAANTLPFEGAVSHLGGAVMAWLSPESGRKRERERGGVEGWWKTREKI